MKLTQLPIGGGAFPDSTRPFDRQDYVNYLVEPTQDPQARASSILRGLPGMTKKLNVGTGPIRGMHNAQGNLFVVSGNELYQVSTAYAATSLGVITGSGPVSIAHNQVTGGNQVMIAAGDDGFVYDTSNSTFTKISDDAFIGSIMADYIDSYIVGVEPKGTFWFTSDLADALSYSTINRYEAEGSPDLIVGILVTHREVWIFGTNTVEVFTDVGASDGAFQRSNGVFIEQGCASRNTIVELDNAPFWLGNDGNIYRAEGYTPVAISTPAVAQDISDKDWGQAFAFGWSDRGHKVYYITFPDGYTWGYDVSSGLWHRRVSYNAYNWRISGLVYWNGVWVSGDSYDNRLYQLDWDVYVEDDVPLVASATYPYMQDGPNRIRVNEAQFLLDTGHGSTADATISMRYSDNNGYDYGYWKDRSLGATGNYGTRVRFQQLGLTRGRLFQTQIASPVKRDIIAAYAGMSE